MLGVKQAENLDPISLPCVVAAGQPASACRAASALQTFLEVACSLASDALWV